MNNPVPDSHSQAVLCPRRLDLANKDEHQRREILSTNFTWKFDSLVLSRENHDQHKCITSYCPHNVE